MLSSEIFLGSVQEPAPPGMGHLNRGENGGEECQQDLGRIIHGRSSGHHFQTYDIKADTTLVRTQIQKKISPPGDPGGAYLLSFTFLL